MIGQLSWRLHLDFWSYGNNFSLSHFFKSLPDNFDKIPIFTYFIDCEIPLQR